MCNFLHQCYYHRLPTSFDRLEDRTVESVLSAFSIGGLQSLEASVLLFLRSIIDSYSEPFLSLRTSYVRDAICP